MRTIDSQNVLAKVEGSDARMKDEYVVYSAHWDHLGVGTPVNGDKIYNGALDNASGVAAQLEMARAFSQSQPRAKRSILFLFVTAEEQGLLGSEHYATHPLYPLRRRSRTSTSTASTSGAAPATLPSSAWGPQTSTMCCGTPRRFAEPHAEPGPGAREGLLLPVGPFQLREGRCAGAVYRHWHEVHRQRRKIQQTKRDEYTANDYHKPSDHIKPDWDLSGAVEDAQLLWMVGYRVANADRIPEWKPGNEFKAKRDAMLKR